MPKDFVTPVTFEVIPELHPNSSETRAMLAKMTVARQQARLI